MFLRLLVFLISLLFTNLLQAQTLTVSTFTTGLNRPVCITNTGIPNDNRIFVCEKLGRIRIIDRNTGALNPTPFLNISSLVYSTGNEQGLLGLAFHPNYASNGYFYVFYNHRVGSTNYTRLARYQVSAHPDTAMINSGVVMMTDFHPFSNHNGGNLMFGKDGYLYISMGDGGSGGDPSNRAQNCDSVLGKLLRIDVNNPNPPYYFSPSSNPFFGGSTPPQPFTGTIPGRDEIYAWGLRNPWRCSIDRLTGDKWIADVGQNNWEEINFESGTDSIGNNYGWRCYEGNAPYSTGGCQPASSYTAPIHVYARGSDCSVTGGYVYRGGREGNMFGKYFFADYCSGKIWKTVPNGSGWTTSLVPQTNTLFTNKFTTWGEDVYGELYLGGDGTAGVIYKVVDTACQPTAYIHAPDTILNCNSTPLNLQAIYGTGLSYTWFVDSVAVFTSSSGSFAYAATPGCHKIHVQVTGICSALSNTIVVCHNTGLAPTLNTIATPSTLCEGANTTLTAIGLSNHQWQPGAINGTSITLSPTVTTTYTVTGVNAYGCTNTATRTITVNPSPTVGTTVSQAIICVGATTQINGTGAVSYQWQPGALNGASITVSPASTTTYTVTGTNSQGCTKTATRTIQVNALPVVGINSTQNTICAGNSTILNGTGANTYLWQPGGLTGNSITVTPTSSTTYTVTGTNTLGCTQTSTRTITVNQLPVLNTSATTVSLCEGSSTTLSATGATTYTWQPGSLTGNSISVTPLITTTYTVTGTSGTTGCSNTGTRIITVYPKPVIQIQTLSDTLCSGVSTSLTASGANTYVWQPGNVNGPTITISPSATSTYTVTGTDLNTCTRTATKTIHLISCPATLDLKLYIEGYYSGAGTMLPVLVNQGVGGAMSNITDTMTIELRNSTAPYGIAATLKTLLHTDGTALCNFLITGNYYIVVKHRNGLQTWSSNPVAFNGLPVNYDFSDALTKAYGNSLKDLGAGIYGIYSGDFDDDENIDLNDLNLLQQDIDNFSFGYYPTDINGDGNVDILDTPVTETNVNGFIFSSHP